VETILEPAPVVGDPGLLDRLAGNLIENAVRYNHLHGRLWVRTGADDSHAWLVVGNTGYEVDPGDVPGLFEPFRRGVGAHRRARLRVGLPSSARWPRRTAGRERDATPTRAGGSR
jgi:signal transduction histidine kinase